MGKRPRDSSSSPLEDRVPTGPTRLSNEPDDDRATKLRVQDASVMPANRQVMQCSLPPHSVSLGFATMEDFEVHYMKEHTNRCVECGNNLPSAHFLTLHIDENHNPLREALAAKGEKTYACFLSDCDRRCSTPQKRRMHMIDKHQFPKVYNFRIVDHGIDNTSSLLFEGRRRRVSVTNSQASSHHQRVGNMSKPADHGRPRMTGTLTLTAPDGLLEGKPILKNAIPSFATPKEAVPESNSSDIGDLEASFAALQFVPRSVLSKTQTKRS